MLVRGRKKNTYFFMNERIEDNKKIMFLKIKMAFNLK